MNFRLKYLYNSEVNMRRNETINILKKQFPKLHKQYGVLHLSLFGSVARDEATAKSDVDVLVEFEGKATFDRFMDLKFFLEDILHKRVDLVTENALRVDLKQLIEKELVHVA